jgi:hypothetical protein
MSTATKGNGGMSWRVEEEEGGGGDDTAANEGERGKLEVTHGAAVALPS